MLSDADLERYSRQLLLPGFSIEEQERLGAASVLIVGCGGLGCPLALYLAAAGIGRLRLADGDQVERSNLARQILFSEADLGENKARAAAAFLAARYPGCTLEAVDTTLDPSTLPDALEGVDLVADGSDNYPIRFALNEACIARDRPLVSAAAVRSEGQLLSLRPGAGTPCYRCVYPDATATTALSCRDSGVLGPVVATLASLQALEVIKLLSGWGTPLLGRMLILDLARNDQRVLDLATRADCPVCAAPHR